MEPMKPMKPMTPMTPMSSEKWWPHDLGEPVTSGSQNELRYAFFPRQRRLLIERNLQLTTYDSGEYDISGVAQSDGDETDLVFTNGSGTVELGKLRKIG